MNKKHLLMLFLIEINAGGGDNLLADTPSAPSAAKPTGTDARELSFTPLFDGKTLTGWEGDTQNTWRVESGAITAGSLLKTVPRNEFIATTRAYENFALRLKYRIVGSEGFVNGGVQLRSQRIPHHYEVRGYQADLGMGFDGHLYDESRRNRMLATPDKATFAKAFKKESWNEYHIRAEGPRIRLWLNGVLTVDYTEQDQNIPRVGIIALQIHGGCKAVVSYKDITIAALPPGVANPKSVPDKKVIDSSMEKPSAARFGELPSPLFPSRAPFRDGLFHLLLDDCVVFVGQTDMVRQRHDSILELFLASRFAREKPRFRNMAWEGDTVYEQWRDLNFGTWTDQLAAVNAGVIIVQFGQMEILDGTAALPAFISAYEKLLMEFAKVTHRIVVVSPRPFSKPQKELFPDHRNQNGVARSYVEALRDLARRRGLLFVDTFTPWQKLADSSAFSENGIHLSPHGRAWISAEIARQLLGNQSQEWLRHPVHAELRAAIVEKNRLWFDNWRPMNWTFAYGDRTTQPFGKPGGGRPALRVELEEFKPLLRAADARVHVLASHLLVEGAAGIPKSMTTPDQKTFPRPTARPSAVVVDTDNTVKEEMAAFRVAPGFAVNLFASEADGVVKPLQMQWDNQGQLWVLCAPTYPHIDPGAVPGDYILVCKDTDGDGRADRFHRFAEGLFLPMGIEFGAGGVYLAEGTELVHLSDSNGDGRADQRTVLLSGFGTADSHQMINGLSWGPAGELWFTQGHHVYSHVETPWSIAKLHKSGVWRYRPRTGRLQGFFPQSTGGLNCQGVTYDDWGQIFHNSAAYSGGFYSVPGLIPTDHPRAYWAMATPDRRNTGIEFIGTRHFPPPLQGCVVWGGFMSNSIQVHRLRDEKSGFNAEVIPDLLASSRPEFRPVNTRIGPDGALYVCDWYNAIIGHYQASYRDPRRDKNHGRIWRVSAVGRPLVKQPDWANLSVEKLLDQLRSTEKYTRYQAKRQLFDLPTTSVSKAADAWLARLDPALPEYEHLLVEIMGVYESHELHRPRLLRQMVEARDYRARAYAMRVVGHRAESLRGSSCRSTDVGPARDSGKTLTEECLSLLETGIRDEHPRVRLEAIVACGNLPAPRAMEVAAESVDRPRDRFIDHALHQTVRALKSHWLPALAKGEIQFGNHAERLRFVLESDGTKDVAALVRQLAANPPTTKPRKIVLIAGTKSHGPGHHEYEMGLRLVKHCLDRITGVGALETELHPDGWPDDPRALDGADSIVLFCDGSDRDLNARPVPAGRGPSGPSVGSYLLVAAINRCVEPRGKSRIGAWFDRAVCWGNCKPACNGGSRDRSKEGNRRRCRARARKCKAG